MYVNVEAEVRLQSLLLESDQPPLLPLGQAVAVRVTLRGTLRPRAVKTSPPLPEERETARACLRLRGHVLSEVRAGSVVWSKYIKLLVKKFIN